MRNRNDIFRTAVFLVLVLGGLVSAAAAGTLPSPEKIVLKNGLTIFYLRNSDVPMVSLRMLIKGAGSANEPADGDGLAGMAAELAMKGTATMSAEALSEALDFTGARLDIGAAEEYAQVSAQGLAQHFPRLLEILTDCLNGPAFKDEEFAKEKARRVDMLKSIKDNPGQAVRMYFLKAYFGANPLGHIAQGTESSLNRMTVRDVRGFFESHYTPERAVAAVVGDISRQDLTTLAEKTLGRWKPRKAAPLAAVPAPPKIKGRKLILIDKPDATQAYFVLGSPGYAMGDGISAPAAVFNTLFGGRFTSWLNSELRIKRGLTYGASSSFRQWAPGGIFNVSSYTKNDQIGQMMAITFGLLKKGTATGFSDEEVESGRNYILGHFPSSLETNDSKASAYVRLAFYKLGFGYYDGYLKEIAGMKKDTVNKAAVGLLPSDDFVLVVVGRAADIREQLKPYGTWQEKKISAPDF